MSDSIQKYQNLLSVFCDQAELDINSLSLSEIC